MNIKIKSAGVFCLLGDDYDKICSTLHKQLGAEGELFSKRTPGHEYLQWELTGDDWTSLSEGDPLMSNIVRQEWTRLQQVVKNKFGTNQDMAQKVLSVPDDSYIYYKPDVNGQLCIRLTAWGYRYPERIGVDDVTGKINREIKEHAIVSVFYDGKPVPNQLVLINGYVRQTDNEGVLELGDLPVGYQLDIEVNGNKQHVALAEGNGNISVDITETTMVEVVVTKDGEPLSDVTVNLDYEGRHLQLSTGANGRVMTQVPLSLTNALCTVSVEGERQQMPLFKPATVFTFALISPAVTPDNPQDDVIDDKEKEGIVPHPSEEITVPEIHEDEKPKEDLNPKDNPEEKPEEKKPEEKPSEEKPVPEPEDTPLWQIILFGLLIILLTALTYMLCKGIIL